VGIAGIPVDENAVFREFRNRAVNYLDVLGVLGASMRAIYSSERVQICSVSVLYSPVLGSSPSTCFHNFWIRSNISKILSISLLQAAILRRTLRRPAISSISQTSRVTQASIGGVTRRFAKPREVLPETGFVGKNQRSVLGAGFFLRRG